MTNYIATSISSAMGLFIGMPINTALFNEVSATVTNFLQNMYQQGMLGSTNGSLPYNVICNLSNNPFTRTSLGYLQCDIQVQYMGIVLYLIANIMGGQTVTITNQSVTSPTNLINS